MKYLGYYLKPNDYIKFDWLWLIKTVKKIIDHWCHRWLCLGGRLILVKSVLGIILVHCMTLSKLPKYILEKIKQKCFKAFMGGEKGCKC